MKEDELKSLTKQMDENLKKHADVINTLTTNQKVLVQKIENLEKNTEINKRVEEIIKETKTEITNKEVVEPRETPKKEEVIKETPKEEPKKEEVVEKEKKEE